MQTAQTIVIGAGPAGLMAGIQAAQAGAKVLMIERLEQPGRKLLATGGGRCNLTNLANLEDFVHAFGRQGRFTLPALQHLDNRRLLDFFGKLGIPAAAEDGFHVFAGSGGAQAVLNALLARFRKLGGRIKCGLPVSRLQIQDSVINGVTAGSMTFEAQRVILAGGGKAHPNLGGNSSALELAEAAGHKIVPCVPGLAPLVTDSTWMHKLSGVSLSAAGVMISGDRKSRTQGPLLFTHHGLSGPAVLNLSAAVAVQLARGRDVMLEIDMLPNLTHEQLTTEIHAWTRDKGRKNICTLLGAYLPTRLARAMCEQAIGTADTRAAELTRSERPALIDPLKRLRVKVIRTAGFAHAMVMRGGISLKQVNPHTMESRLVKGLFFAGEMLDLDGPCGGYNLQWAMSSGALAGRIGLPS